MSNQTDIPDEISGQVKNFHQALSDLKKTLEPVLQNADEVRKLASIDPETHVTYDLTIAYAVNSLYWMYQIANGENPKNHRVKLELERVRKYMQRLQILKDKKDRPKINPVGSKNVVRNALFDPNASTNAKMN